MSSNTKLPSEGVLWKIYRNVRAIKERRSLGEHDVRERVLEQLAVEYGISTDDIKEDSESAIYTVASKLHRLLFPVSSSACANLDRELAIGIPFNQALLIARGRYASREEIIEARANNSKLLETRGIPLEKLFTAVIETARRSKFSAREIEIAFNDAYDTCRADKHYFESD
jgi:hypothetical protein